jgi:hypothetical protein
VEINGGGGDAPWDEEDQQNAVSKLGKCYNDYKLAVEDCAQDCLDSQYGDGSKNTCIGIQVQSQSPKKGNKFVDADCEGACPFYDTAPELCVENEHWQCEKYSAKGIFKKYRDTYPAGSTYYYFADLCCVEAILKERPNDNACTPLEFEVAWMPGITPTPGPAIATPAPTPMPTAPEPQGAAGCFTRCFFFLRCSASYPIGSVTSFPSCVTSDSNQCQFQIQGASGSYNGPQCQCQWNGFSYTHTPGQTQIQPPSAEAPVLTMTTKFAGEAQRCHGAPLSINGVTWGGLGIGLTKEQCEAACLEADICMFAVWDANPINLKCSAFPNCDLLQPASGKAFTVFEKKCTSEL